MLNRALWLVQESGGKRSAGENISTGAMGQRGCWMYSTLWFEGFLLCGEYWFEMLI
jgi:hypothetical protein